MWDNSAIIQNPFGISVFGSALLRVSPDLASLTAAVVRLEQKPSDAFARAKEDARNVADFLHHAGIEEFGMSRISLSQKFRFRDSERYSLGYEAKIGFTVVVNALDCTEEIVSGMVDSGANEISSIEFQSSNLKNLRTQARTLAMTAAKEKAIVYAAAAGVVLGNVMHIQDMNPNALLKRRFHIGAGGGGQIPREPVDNEPEKQTLDPEAIEIGAVVLVAFSLKN